MPNNDKCIVWKWKQISTGKHVQNIDKSETGPEDASYKLKWFTEKIIEDNNSRKYNNISTYKKADNKEIRIRRKDIQEKEDLEEIYIFDKCSINEVLTSTP